MTEMPQPSGPGAARSFPERIVAALKLDATVFDEVEHDESALPQAAGVIALAALAQGIGSLGAAGVGGLVAGVVAGAVAWGVGTTIVWLIGVKAMGHDSDFPELLRTLGFASAPQVLLVAGLLPLGPLRWVLVLGVTVVTLIAWVLAVRQALDVDTGRAVLVCILAAVASVVLAPVIGLLTCAGAGV